MLFNMSKITIAQTTTIISQNTKWKILVSLILFRTCMLSRLFKNKDSNRIMPNWCNISMILKIQDQANLNKTIAENQIIMIKVNNKKSLKRYRTFDMTQRKCIKWNKAPVEKLDLRMVTMDQWWNLKARTSNLKVWERRVCSIWRSQSRKQQIRMSNSIQNKSLSSKSYNKNCKT